MVRSTFLLPLAALALAPLASAQTFTYNAAALPGQVAIWTDGVAIADLDGDGDKDIAFANGTVYGGTGASGAAVQQLWLNSGAGVFVAANANLNVANFNAKMVIAEDFDNDGDRDLFYASGSTGSPPRLLRNNGAAVFTDVTATNVPVLALRSFSLCAGDVDNDGDLDVVVNDGGTFGGTAAQARLLLNNGAGVFTDVTAAQMPVDLYNCQDITLIDFDGDFDVDIALSGKGGTGKRGRLYLNNGSGTFSINTVMDAVGSGNTYEVDWCDLDGDSDFDTAVQSTAGVSEGWGKNLGTATPILIAAFPAPNGDDDNEMAGLDYDNDGDLDVFVGSLAAKEKAYRNDGGVFVNVNAIIQSQADATLDLGFGDLNNDGKYDMVTGQGESGNFTNKVYMNNGAADTLPPVLLASSTPVIANPTTVFHMRLSDAIADDGTTNVSMTYSWKTNLNTLGGSGTSFHMGNGLFRSPVPTAVGTTWVWINCTAIDSSGNSASFGPTVIGTPPNPWSDIGFGTAGITGIPALNGVGTLLANTLLSINLTNAKPASTGGLFVSTLSFPQPFKGGMLAAFPFLSGFPIVLPTGAGSIAIPSIMPPGVNGLGVSLYFQYVIVDAAGPNGYSLSNTLRGQVP